MPLYPWSRTPHALAMPDDSDPPRKFYTMKPREIERLNAPPGQSSKVGEIKVQDHLNDVLHTHRRPPDRPREALPLVTSALPVTNDVEAIVQANARKEHAAGLHDIGLDRPRRPTRRRRDYVTLLILGNLCILGAVAVAGFNVMSVVFGLSAAVLFSVSVTWIIWVVMDKY